MTTIGMDTTVPTIERAKVMILALIDGVPFPAKDLMEIRARLARRDSNRHKGPRLGLACKRNHPDVPSRWAGVIKKSRRSDGQVAFYRSVRCSECDRARETARALMVCPKCRHQRTDHEAEDGGRCYHKKHGVYDCDCAGTKESR